MHDFLCTANEAVLTTYNIGRTETENIKRELKKIAAAEVHCTATRAICVHNLGYTAVNLIWNPYGSLTLGMEFLYGWWVNEDGSSGNAPRIMFSAKYNFVRVQSRE